MNPDTLAHIALVLAALPCGLFFLNLLVYRPVISNRRAGFSGISVLIPARNEEHSISATIQSVLAGQETDFEVIVLDDHSTDRTREIVGEIARHDPRLRLESAPALPPGWCGKQHACQVLARLARHPLLVFIDADVRLEPDALVRMAGFMEESGADLASGVPRQETGTFSDRLLIPLIHFILLGFLPMHAMRGTKRAAFSAGCGQLFVARRNAYFNCGGHAMIRESLHDGLKLPRLFRRAGFATTLFDATDLAVCRMYHTNAEVWRGLGKNATEGLAAPATILPMTALLFGGQTMPFVLLLCAPALSGSGLTAALLAGAFALLPRVAAARRFKQPPGATLLHPFGILALLGIQWSALGRSLLGRPAVWKGRTYGLSPATWPLAPDSAAAKD